MVKQIEIKGGYYALVDDSDFDVLLQSRWYYLHGYAYRTERTEGKTRTQWMHRVIMDAPSGLEVDHINGNRLDNRSENLRLVTRSQNCQNVRHPSRSSTGVRNVYWLPEKQRYQVKLKLNQKNITCGNYATLEEASRVASEARRQYMTHSLERSEARP